MQTMVKDRTNGIIRDHIDRKAGFHRSLNDPRGEVAAHAADWLDRNIIGIGWDFDGAEIANMSREQIKVAYVSAHPAESKRKVAASVGQVYRFAHSMAQVSTIVMYNPAERLYHIGAIEGPRAPASEPESVTYTRAVSWHETAPRDILVPASKSSRGSIVHRRSEGGRPQAIRLHGRLHQGSTLRGRPRQRPHSPARP